MYTLDHNKMEEIYSITSEYTMLKNSVRCADESSTKLPITDLDTNLHLYKLLSKESLHSRLRCMTLLNMLYEYDEETVDIEFQIELGHQSEITNWKSIFVASLSESDNEEQLRKVFKFFGIISKIEIHEKTAIIFYENWYVNEFICHMQQELEKKLQVDRYNYIHSICLVYTVWQEPMIPIRKNYLALEFEENYLENHKEIEHIRIYDVYMMPEGVTLPPSNYENASKLYETVCYYKERLARRIEKSVDEEPSEENMDRFYSIGFRR